MASRKSKRSSRKARTVNGVVNIKTNHGTINANGPVIIGRDTGKDAPELLDRTKDAFKFDENDPTHANDPTPPGPASMKNCTVYGNRCNISTRINIGFATSPWVKFDKDKLLFNGPAIEKYGLVHGMTIIVAQTEGRTGIRFFLGNDKFINGNEIHQFGFFTLRIKDKPRVQHGPPDAFGNLQNPTQRLGYLACDAHSKDRFGGTFPLIAAYPEWENCTARLYFDRRAYKTENVDRRRVLFVLTKDIQPIPEDPYEKTREVFDAVVNARYSSNEAYSPN